MNENILVSKGDSKIVKQIRSSQSYSDLPHHRILRSPFSEKSIYSFGVIAYCLETKKWLLVRRQYSPSYIVLIRGSYRMSDLKIILPMLSVREIEKVQDLISNPDKFDSVFKETISNDLSEFQYAKLRFIELKSYISVLLLSISGVTDTEWLWPKGRLNFSGNLGKSKIEEKEKEEKEEKIEEKEEKRERDKNIREKPLQCAAREFKEETGIELTNQKLVSHKPLIETFRGFNGKLYETKCWIYLFDDEIQPPKLSSEDSPREIGECKWMTEEEAEKVLNDVKFKLLKVAQRIISYSHEYTEENGDTSPLSSSDDDYDYV